MYEKSLNVHYYFLLLFLLLLIWACQVSVLAICQLFCKTLKSARPLTFFLFFFFREPDIVRKIDFGMVSTVPDSCKSEFALTDNFWDFSIYMLKLACTRRKKLAVGLLQVLVCLTDLKKEEEKDQCVCVCVCGRACMYVF